MNLNEMKKQDFNGGWIVASQEAYDLLIEAGYKPPVYNNICFKTAGYHVRDNKFFIADIRDYHLCKESIEPKQFYINNGALSWDEPKGEEMETISIADDKELVCKFEGIEAQEIFKNELFMGDSILEIDKKYIITVEEIKPKCNKCGDILQGRDDDSSTTCRWCIQGWTEDEPIQLNATNDLNDLPIGEEDGQMEMDNVDSSMPDSLNTNKLDSTLSITDKDGKVYKFEKDRLYNHRLFYVDINNKTVFGIANCSSVYWKEDGKCYNAYDSERLEVYDLTPIKPKELTLNEILQDVQDKQMSVHASELLIKAQFKISEES